MLCSKNFSLITAHKQSLWQGYMFTGVCLSRGVTGPGGWCQGVPDGDTPQMATAVGGTHPTGMHSCLMIYLYCEMIIIIQCFSNFPF